GSVAAVSQSAFRMIRGFSIFISITIILFYKELLTLSFDEEHASVPVIHSIRVHFVFIVLTALVVGVSIRVVGSLAVSALMTLPVAAAMRIASSFKQLIVISIVFAEIAVIGGLISGYYFSIPPGGTIVMSSIAILLISMGINRFTKTFKKEGI